MVSQIKVNEIIKQSGSSITIGESGDTLTFTGTANFGTVIPTASLGTGTASSSTFLRGDQTWDAAGGVNTPAFMVKKNDSQTVSDATWTTLTWETEVFDTDNTFASNRFTPAVAGKYLLCVFVYAYSDGGSLEGTGIGLKFLKNGSAEGYTYLPSTSDGQTGVFFSRVVESDTNDYFDAQVNINVNGGTPTANDQAFFYGYKLIT